MRDPCPLAQAAGAQTDMDRSCLREENPPLTVLKGFDRQNCTMDYSDLQNLV